MNDAPLPQHVIRMRIKSAVGRGCGLHQKDMARFFEMSWSWVRAVGEGIHPMTPEWQIRFSALLLAWDRGEYQRAADGSLVRVAPPSEAQQPRATIDLSGAAPRVNWRP